MRGRRVGHFPMDALAPERPARQIIPMVNKRSSGERHRGSAPAAVGGGGGRTVRRRARGRPPSGSQSDVREALLESARVLFLRHGFQAVSNRQIATAAGANVAMIRYYFGGKAGLYREILGAVLAPVRQRIDAMAGGQAPVDLLAVLALGMRAWAGNPWMAGFVVREVLSGEGPMRTLFLREIAGRLVPLLESLIAGEVGRGRLRAGLDTKLTALSMVSLIVFPFLAFPVTSRLFDVRRDEAFLGRLTGHTRDLLLHGLARAGSTP